MRKHLALFALLAWTAFHTGFGTASAAAADFERSEIAPASLYTPEQLRDAKFETRLSFLLFPTAGWNQSLVLGHMRGLAGVYLQCGLKFSQVSVYTPNKLSLPLLSKFKKEGPDSLLALAEQTTELPRPLTLLVGDFSDAEASPFSRAQFREMQEQVPAALRNTVWLPMHVNSPEYINERKNSPYSSLAHELSHVLMLDGDHNNDTPPNLMTIYMRRTDRLTPEQCQEILKSEFVRAAPAPLKFIPPNPVI